MDLRSWWNGLSRSYQNTFFLLAFDCAVFLGAFAGFLPFKAAWESFTGFLPNIYEGIAVQLISLVRDASPGSVVIGGVAMDAATTLLSLLSLHVIVGFGIGFLFDHAARSRLWTFLNYFTLILILFTVHFFLIVTSFL
jgi:hypothetical protein